MLRDVPAPAVLALVLATLIMLLILVRRRVEAERANRIDATDMSHGHFPPPPAARPVIAELQRLGFRRIGEAAINPQAPGPAVWYLLDTPGTTCAGVFEVHNTGVAVIYSWFGDDDAVLVTGFPAGTTIDDPDFRFHTVDTSLEDAYRYHLGQLTEFGAAHGFPLKLNSMQEILRLDHIYNERFAPRRRQASSSFNNAAI